MESTAQGYLNFKRSSAAQTSVPPEPRWFFANGKLVKTGNRNINRAIHVHPPEISTIPKTPSENEPEFTNYLSFYAKLWGILEKHFANPLSSLVASKTMLLPHQVQAALHVVESVQPRVLIADEVGLGKTVEAGLIIKELILKQNCETVLIAVPAPLVYQWQSEMKHKFNENFVIVNGPVLRKNPNIVENEKRIIVSIDLLRDKDRWGPFLEKNFDIIVFDEAHRLRKDQTKATKAYQFAEQISPTARALILLSATPFRGKLEEIYYLIQLIDPDILGPMHTFLSSYTDDNTNALRKKLSPVVIRRRKVDIGGFTKRFAKTIKLTLPPLERAFYDQVTEYVKKEYNRAMDSHQHVRAFVAIVFQKLLDSSSHALLHALKKRKVRLEKMYYRLPKDKQTKSRLFEIPDEDDELDEEEEGDFDLESIFDPAEIREEIMSITRLISLGEKIETDYKLASLRDILIKLKKEGHEKVIIFTQFRRTMEYIHEYIRDYFQVTLFHGGLTALDKEQMIEDFFTKTDILICTEAGGEGRNLQVASALINYDLPWSPLKVEQRIGRIHRFGQKNDVYIINFATKDTIAEKILEILEKKIQLFENAFGSSDILLGMTEDDSSIEKSLQNLLDGRKSKKENDAELKTSLQAARDNLHKIENLISTEVLDFNMQAFQAVLETKESGFETEEIIEEISLGVNELTNEKLKNRGGDITFAQDGEFRTGTFYLETSNKKGHLDYLTIGHPFVDRALKQLVEKVEPSVYYNAETLQAKEKGIAYYFEVKIHLDRVYNRRYNIFIDDQNDQPGEVPNYANSIISCEPASTTFKEGVKNLEKAIQGVHSEIEHDIEKLLSKTKYGINFWKQNIRNSHKNSESELKEKLEIQQGKAHWYGEERMSGAIQRTINKKKSENNRVKDKLHKLESQLKLRIDLYIKHVVFLNMDSEM
ncbi:MAG: SNF2-related protein [Leptospirales bacterium]